MTASAEFLESTEYHPAKFWLPLPCTNHAEYHRLLLSLNDFERDADLNHIGFELTLPLRFCSLVIWQEKFAEVRVHDIWTTLLANPEAKVYEETENILVIR